MGGEAGGWVKWDWEGALVTLAKPRTFTETPCFSLPAGFARPSPQLKDRKTLSRRPARTTGRGRCQDNPEAGSASPKRHCRHLSPEARAPLAVLTSRLFTQVDALDVALDELRAPGGAFLPVPSRSTQPTASQRAWLSWQLAHAGASLHWALASLDTLLAARPRLTCQQPCVPHAPRR